MAEPIPQEPPVLSQREKHREQLAFDQGHDADLPTNEEESIPAEQSSSRATTEVEAEKDLEAGVRERPSTVKEVAEAQPAAEAVDPNIVSWDGPDDPANPLNWSEKLKWSNIAVISSITLLTYGISNPFALSFAKLSSILQAPRILHVRTRRP